MVPFSAISGVLDVAWDKYKTPPMSKLLPRPFHSLYINSFYGDHSLKKKVYKARNRETQKRWYINSVIFTKKSSCGLDALAPAGLRECFRAQGKGLALGQQSFVNVYI